MQAKDFRKAYLYFVSLYGVIYSEDAYRILKFYFPDLKKEQLLKDLKDRATKLTREYIVVETDKKNLYVIAEPYLDYEDYDRIFKEQANKPYYYPTTFEGLCKFEPYQNWLELNDKNLTDMINYFIDRGDTNLKIIELTMVLYWKVRDQEPIEKLIEYFKDYGFEIKTQEDLAFVMSKLIPVMNNTRLRENRGYTPSELSRLMPKGDLDNTILTLGPNVRAKLKSGEINPYDYYQEVLKADMPKKMKESLLKELKDIITSMDKDKN